MKQTPSFTSTSHGFIGYILYSISAGSSLWSNLLNFHIPLYFDSKDGTHDKKWYSFIHPKLGEKVHFLQVDSTHINQIRGYFPHPAPVICPCLLAYTLA